MKAEAEKRRKHQAKCDEARITFTPFAMETSGGLGPSAEATWRQIVRFAADRKVGDKTELSQRWAWGLGTSLMREIGKSVTDRGHLCMAMGGALRERVEVDELPPVEPDYFLQPPDLPPEFPEVDQDLLDSVLEAEEARTQREQPASHRDIKRPRSAPTVPHVAGCGGQWKPVLEGMAGKSAREQLRELQAQRVEGFKFVPGNCAFDAVAFLTFDELALSSLDLRLLAVDKVWDSEDLAEKAEPNAATWARLKRVDGSAHVDTWADYVALAGLARVLGIVLMVVTDGSLHIFGPLREARDAVALLHSGGAAGHYEPLVLGESLRTYLRQHYVGKVSDDSSACPGGEVRWLRDPATAAKYECVGCARWGDRAHWHQACSGCHRAWCSKCGSDGRHCPGRRGTKRRLERDDVEGGAPSVPGAADGGVATGEAGVSGGRPPSPSPRVFPAAAPAMPPADGVPAAEREVRARGWNTRQTRHGRPSDGGRRSWGEPVAAGRARDHDRAPQMDGRTTPQMGCSTADNPAPSESRREMSVDASECVSQMGCSDANNLAPSERAMSVDVPAHGSQPGCSSPQHQAPVGPLPLSMPVGGTVPPSVPSQLGRSTATSSAPAARASVGGGSVPRVDGMFPCPRLGDPIPGSVAEWKRCFYPARGHNPGSCPLEPADAVDCFREWLEAARGVNRHGVGVSQSPEWLEAKRMTDSLRHLAR